MKRLGQIIRTNRILQVLLILWAVTGMGTGFLMLKRSALLMPGQLTAAHPQNEPINGYVSHADFEKECVHCHAPVHCISDDRCQECHQEIARQRTTASGLHSRLPGTTKCQTCHTEHQGREASITDLAFANVNHERLASYSLDKHNQNYDGTEMDCETCHSQDSYVEDTLDCISCHSQEDHDSMAAHIEEYGTRCVDCHDGKDRMIEFDHNSVYVLDGAHTDVACQDCHIDNVYADTPANCIDCHKEPELHANLFGQDCVRCHTAVAWAPAALLQHTFLIDHGASEEDIASCETCHAGTYTEYPCYSCHEYADMEVAVGHDVPNLEDCVACHPTGRGVVSEEGSTTGKIDIIASGNP